jgi:kynurenine formamidase
MRRLLTVVMWAVLGVAARAAGMVDLTHPFDESTIYWPTANSFHLTTVHKGPTPGGWWYESNDYGGSEHGGTHMDAPVHFFRGGLSVDEIPLSVLTGPAVVIDTVIQCRHNPDYMLTTKDLNRWESRHGRIPDGSIVLLYTGWGHFWPDKKKYMGTDKKGDVAGLHFPAFGAEAARWLVEERHIKMAGLDTASVDPGQSKDFPVHVVFGRAGVPGLENVADLHKLPTTGATITALPMKIRGGSGGPVRIVAVLP